MILSIQLYCGKIDHMLKIVKPQTRVRTSQMLILFSAYFKRTFEPMFEQNIEETSSDLICVGPACYQESLVFACDASMFTEPDKMAAL